MTGSDETMKNSERDMASRHVSQCLQLAILLEVSAYRKPGNVHRTADFEQTRYEHFLASAVAVAPHFTDAANRGIRAFKREIPPSEIAIGEIIRNSVSDMVRWQHGMNTLLGSIILLSPMAAAVGFSTADEKAFDVDSFRESLKSIVRSTTSRDALNLYDAIALARPGGLGKSHKLDATDPESKRKILEENVTLFEIFKISAPWDSISAEWISNFHLTFDVGYPYLKHEISRSGDINQASVHTFLRILSETPDTLIARKAGKNKAEMVSEEARKVLDLGGLATKEGRRSVLQLDRKLRDANHTLNPGASADITAAALAVAVLEGYRP